MPRRNSKALKTAHKPRSTHVIIDTMTGRRMNFGTKAEMQWVTEGLNTAAGTHRYHVKPIHK